MAKHHSIESCIKALKESGGFVSHAAKMLRMSQGSLSDRISKNKRLQEAKAEIEDSYLDLAESKLIKKVNKEDLGAICFFLKCKGKKRGYIERQEITGADGAAIATRNINTNMSEEDAARAYKDNVKGD